MLKLIFLQNQCSNSNIAELGRTCCCKNHQYDIVSLSATWWSWSVFREILHDCSRSLKAQKKWDKWQKGYPWQSQVKLGWIKENSQSMWYGSPYRWHEEWQTPQKFTTQVLKRRVFLKPSKIRKMEKGKKTGIRKVESSWVSNCAYPDSKLSC